MRRQTRRTVLRTGAAVGTVGLAGCLDREADSSIVDDLLGITGQDAPGDWRQYRGGPGNAGTAAGSGLGDDPRIEWEWEPTHPEAEADQEIHSDSIGDVLVVDDFVYIDATYSYVNPEKGLEEAIQFESRLFAVDIETGDTRWSVELPGGTPRIPRYSPATDGEHVYTFQYLEDEFKFVAVDIESREVSTRVPLDPSVNSGMSLADGTVYFCGEAVHAHSTDTGQSKWDYILESDGRKLRPHRYVPPTVTDTAVYAAVGEEVVALDPDDGSERWRVEAGHEGRTHGGVPMPCFSPVVVDGALYLTSGKPFHGGDGDLIALDPADGSERWRYQPAGADVDPADLDDPMEYPRAGVYGVPTPGSDSLFAVGFQEGEPHVFSVGTDGEQHWSSPAEWLSLSTVLADGQLYVLVLDGVVVFDADDGRRLAEIDFPTDPIPNYASPAVVGDRLLVPVRERLVSLQG